MAPEQPAEPEQGGEPSRRLSTCAYQVSFPAGSAAISPRGRQVIAEAVREARTNGSRGVVTVHPAQSPQEGRALRQRRGDTIVAELRRLGLADGGIETLNVDISHPEPLAPKVHLDVCDPRTEAVLDTLPMPPANRIARYEMRGVRLAVPLPYLLPHSWVDTPIGVQPWPVLTFHLSWPGLEPVRGGWKRDRMCQRDPVCWHSIALRVEQPPLIDPDPGLLRQARPDGERMRRLSGRWAGLRFVTYPKAQVPVAVALFEGVLADGTRVTGRCGWQPRPGQRDYPSADEVGAALQGSDASQCSLDQFYGAGGLRLSVFFSARHIADWRAIREETAGFVAGLASGGDRGEHY